MSSSLSDTDIFPLRFCLFPEPIKCHFILSASQRQCGRLQVLTDICHWMEGIFRGSKSFHPAKLSLSPASSFPLDIPLSVYLICQRTNDVCLSHFPKAESRGQMVSAVWPQVQFSGTEWGKITSAQKYLKFNSQKRWKSSLKFWEIWLSTFLLTVK